MYVCNKNLFRQRPLKSLLGGPSGLFLNCSKSSLYCQIEQMCLDQCPLNCFCSWLWRHVQPQANHSTSTVLPQRIPASASMIIDSDWPPDRIDQQIASVDASVPPKPAHRVLEDTEVLSDVNSLQPAAGSWTWFVALLGASADCLSINVDTGANFGIRSTRRAAAFKILWTRSVCTAEIPDRAELQ